MYLFAATVFASAFLLFLVQPIIAKQILPWFGGNASVWTVCMVFFQLVLLGGYAYADALANIVTAKGAIRPASRRECRSAFIIAPSPDMTRKASRCSVPIDSASPFSLR